MKNIFLCLLVIFVLQISVKAQTCPGNITFTTQTEIDAFATTYPGCATISGNIEISGSDISNLNGLSMVTSIGGSLSINSNSSLTSLTGLSAVTSIDGGLYIQYNETLINLTGLSAVSSIGGELSIYSNSLLASLSGLNTVTSIGGGLYIQSNPSLASLTGLNAVTSIDGGLYIQSNPSLTSLTGLNAISFIGGGLIIQSNPSLTSLTGLDAVSSIGGGISINYNEALTSLSGLNPAMSIFGGLSINYNAALSTCDIQSICNFLSVSPNNANIYGNATGCANVAQVQTACEIPVTCPYNITFTMQTEIDAFATTYPGCATISGNIEISGSDISNLYGLSMVTSIGGSLSINSNSSLTSLTGLSAVTSIGGGLYIQYNEALINLTGLSAVSSIGGELSIYSNSLLASLSGLNTVTSIGGGLYIQSNPSLASLTGLNAVTSIDGGLYIQSNPSLTSLTGLNAISFIGGGLIIQSNTSITSLTGLDAVSSIGGGISINYNEALTSLSGLNPAMSIFGGLSINYNAALSTCDIQSICNFLSISPNNANIYGNATNCANVAQVQLECYCPPISLTITGTNCFPGSTTKITANAGSGFTYLWNTGQTTRAITIPAGTYCVTATQVSTGCTKTSCITVCKKPTVMISPVTTPTICIGECFPLKAIAGNTSNYQWSNGGPSSDVYSVCPTAATTVYTVTATNNPGCSATKAITVKTVTCSNSSGCAAPNDLTDPGGGIEFYQADPEEVIEELNDFGEELAICSNEIGLVQAYPNPASLEVILNYTDHVAEIESLTLFDLNGKEMLPVQVMRSGVTRLDVSELPTGVYVLKINGGDAMRIAVTR